MQAEINKPEDRDLQEAELTWEGKHYYRGINRGAADMLLSIYQQRLGAVPESVQGALFAIKEPARLTALLPAFLNGDADAIARALLS